MNFVINPHLKLIISVKFDLTGSCRNFWARPIGAPHCHLGFALSPHCRRHPRAHRQPRPIVAMASCSKEMRNTTSRLNDDDVIMEILLRTLI
jgi:hypothetical protein